jgi:DNA-binding NarL/FixJ family response regulator
MSDRLAGRRDRLAVALAIPSALVRAGLAAGLREHGVDTALAADDWAAVQAAGFGGADVVIASADDPALRAGDSASLHSTDGVPLRAAGRASPRMADDSALCAETDDGPPLLLLARAGDPLVRVALAQQVAVLPERSTVAQIADGARAVARGLLVTTPALLDELLAPSPVLPRPPPREAREPAALREPLTPREREVLQQLALGRGNRAIAEALGISTHTAKFHVAQILAKLAAASRTDAVTQGLRAGLVEL